MCGMRLITVLALSSVLSTQAPALRIVVVEGEDAVNIIQQKTAVRPLIQVVDRNNLPVPGATVTFTVSGQPAAFANGAPTLTVTTNASGQAAASGFTAIRPGAVQIQVSAAHQGQVASAVISQTNFATAAAAAAAAGVAAGAAGGTATGGAAATGAAAGGAAGGGGISATTIAIVGAAVGGGAVAATTVAKKSDEGGGGNFDGYHGSFTGPYVFTNTGPASTCVFNRTVSGTMNMDLRTDRSGGAVRLQGTITEISAGGSCIPSTAPVNFSVADITANGGPSNLSFSVTRTVAANSTETWSFSGSFTNNTVTGTLTFEQRQQTSTGGSTFTGVGSGSFPATLTR
jgi:hypothetical protein